MSDRKRALSSESELTPARKINPSSVQKTPPPSLVMDQNQKLDQIMADMARLKKLEDGIEAIQVTQSSHTESLSFLDKTLDSLKTKTEANETATTELRSLVHEYRAELQECKAEIAQLRDQVLNLEAYSRRENLVFLNIPEQKEENCAAKISSIIQKEMKIPDPIKFTRVHRLGTYNKEVTRPIIVRFHYGPDRMKVWKAKSNLTNSGIIIREDYPSEMEQARRILRPIHNHALFLGMESRLVKDTLIIGGRRYTTKNIDTLPECLHPHNICQICFHGRWRIFAIFW